MQFFYIKNQRGHNNLIYKNYIYNLDGSKQQQKRWRCLNRRCKSILIVNDSGFIEYESQHNHDEEKLKIENLQIRNKLKLCAINTREPPKNLIALITKDIKESELANLFKYKSLTDRITKERNKKLGNFTLEIDDIPLTLKLNLRKERFLFYDSGVKDENRVIIYCSDFCFTQLNQIKTWLVDGTFKSVPSSFCQLVTIHGIFLDSSVPLAYILMKNKKEITYVESFRKIKNQITSSPNIIIIDFEKAISNSLNFVFPKTKLTGCIFHFGQMCWRKIQNLNISKLYLQDIDFKKYIRIFLNLVFVPADKITFEFAKITQIEIFKKFEGVINDFKNYFIKNFIGEHHDTENFKAPMYSPEFWSVHKNIINGISRSTCAIEAWHSSLNRIFSMPHPNFAKFVDVILNEEEVVRIKILQAKFGKFRYSEKNYSKERNLLLITKEYYFFEDLGFYNALEEVYNWKFDK